MKSLLLAALIALGSPLAHAFPTYATGGFRGTDLMTSDEVKAHAAKERYLTLPEKGGDPCKVMRFMGRIH